ncbi:hypothetical protein [Falsihalocynthiibacter sp. CO-5D18]|uniref:hypothetical protein n=1 Tax=Falsihalocynthiibacter sp. CO-5D18 TaxID=3240872 RepID=UPI00350EB26A
MAPDVITSAELATALDGPPQWPPASDPLRTALFYRFAIARLKASYGQKRVEMAQNMGLIGDNTMNSQFMAAARAYTSWCGREYAEGRPTDLRSIVTRIRDRDATT